MFKNNVYSAVIGCSFYFIFLAVPRSMQKSQFLDQESNPCPLRWKHGALTTGPSGILLGAVFKIYP